ncbi:P-loop containing nucleoside triphosphate hydrolase [Fusarium albosuccineum]|uniref:P-loop containing nucleoside triphosphate hydrolase n=1 Tax=Fusarium albosuccineum TaxID=1237068 RepID=A0A8H4KVY6_9HYPO|nr:P-loop containing nucleoside triphosphate hydrolase [Fusarium albosuccineum]
MARLHLGQPAQQPPPHHRALLIFYPFSQRRPDSHHEERCSGTRQCNVLAAHVCQEADITVLVASDSYKNDDVCFASLEPVDARDLDVSTTAEAAFPVAIGNGKREPLSGLAKLSIPDFELPEKEALQRSSWFISDRCGFDPLVYARKYVSDDAALEMQRQPSWIEDKARMTDSLIVVCEAGTPQLADDGVRLMPVSEEAWMQLFDEFCGLLYEVGLQYVVVPRTMLDLSERADFLPNASFWMIALQVSVPRAVCLHNAPRPVERGAFRPKVVPGGDGGLLRRETYREVCMAFGAGAISYSSGLLPGLFEGETQRVRREKD